jgi:hypothetical protein
MNYDQVIEHFNHHLGAEARGIARALIAERDAEG